jgi:hypothetical protein
MEAAYWALTDAWACIYIRAKTGQADSVAGSGLTQVRNKQGEYTDHCIKQTRQVHRSTLSFSFQIEKRNTTLTVYKAKCWCTFYLKSVPGVLLTARSKTAMSWTWAERKLCRSKAVQIRKGSHCSRVRQASHMRLLLLTEHDSVC